MPSSARIVGTHLGIMVNNKGEEINADYNFATASSVLRPPNTGER